jgi:hypothetical protein
MGEYVNQKTLALTALVLLSVAAISMAAATVANVESTTGDGDGRPTNPLLGGGDQSPAGNDTQRNGGSGNPFGEGNDTTDQQLELRGCNDLLSSLPGSLGYFAVMAGLIFLIRKRTSLGFSLLAAYAITPIFLTVYFLRTQCGGTGTGISNGTIGEGNGSGPIENVGPNIPPVFLVGGFAVLFVGVAAVLYISSGSREYVPEEEDEEEEPDVADIAAAAGAAAERLEARDADVDNEVYRAWWEMTQLLNVSSPETYTPGQFADAAVELGIDKEHVDALTTLFEEVRYGHQDPESREERAIEVFREIEKYGEETAAGSDTADAEPDGADGETEDDE